MADLARMRFHSERFPAGDGALVLADDLRFRIEASEAMLEQIAAREREIVERSWRTAIIAASGLIVLGAGALAAGWLAGRIGGRLRERYAKWRPAQEATIAYAEKQGLKLTFMPGKMQPAVTLEWTPGEYESADDAEHCYAAFQRARKV